MCAGTVVAVTTSTMPAPARATVSAPGRRSVLWSLPEVRWAAAASGLFALGGLVQLTGGPAPLFWALYLACYAVGGWEPAWAGLQVLRARALDVDLLMIVAAIGAAAIG